MERTAPTIDSNEIKELRRLALEVVELGCSFLDGNPSEPVVHSTQISPTQSSPLSDAGLGTSAALEMYWNRFGDMHTRSSGPRYFGFVTGGAMPAATAADLLVTFLDQNVATERHSIATFIEVEALSQILDLLRLPNKHFHGILTTGASAASLVGLATARQWCGEQVGYNIAADGMANADPITVFGAAPHSSILKALSVLGFGQNNIKIIPMLPQREAIDIDALEVALAACTTSGRIVIASAGTVNTGDFDDLNAVADLCDRYNVWLHVDGAFGAFARSLDETSHLAEGLERARSFTADGHKLLNVPYDCGLAFTTEPGCQERAFSADAPYVPMDSQLPAFMNRGVEQSRRYRALPLWMNLSAYGRLGMETVFRNCFEMAAIFSRRLTQDDRYDVISTTRLNIVAFKLKGPSPATERALNKSFVNHVNASGELFLTPTELDGAFVIRIAISNWRTTKHDVEQAMEAFDRAYTLAINEGDHA